MIQPYVSASKQFTLNSSQLKEELSLQMFSNQDYAQDGEILKLEECDTVHPFVT
jgi:hypothetical protein